MKISTIALLLVCFLGGCAFAQVRAGDRITSGMVASGDGASAAAAGVRQDDAEVLNLVLTTIVRDNRGGAGKLYFAPTRFKLTTNSIQLASNEDFEKLPAADRAAVAAAAQNLVARSQAGDRMERIVPQDKRFVRWPGNGDESDPMGYGTNETVFRIVAPGFSPDGNTCVVQFMYNWSLNHDAYCTYGLRRAPDGWKVLLMESASTL